PSDRRLVRHRHPRRRSRGSAARTRRRGRHGLARHHRPELVRSVHRPAADHPVRDPVRAARRAGEAAAQSEDGREPRRVVDGEPWPAFMTFYGTTATAAGIVVPKKYLTQVGEDGFRKHPIGAGPYRYVSQTPGVEVVLEAYTAHWRRVPSVKRLVMKSVADGNTRVAMLKTGEADVAYALDGPDAENVKRDPRLTLLASRHASIFWIEFAEQWDPKSPWADKRLRLAVNHALDRKTINEAACLGFCPPAGVIVPRVMDFALPVEPPAYDPAKARQLLAEAGYPKGLDAGDFVPIPPFFTTAE